MTTIYVTSFSSISFCSNCEYWTQKRTQSESIHFKGRAPKLSFPFRAAQAR